MLDFIKGLFSSGPKSRAHIVVKGRVFDGSYHVFAEKLARESHLAGWLKVRDAMSSNAFLELEVEGADSKVKAYIMELRKGNRDSHVEMVTVQWKTVGSPRFTGFSRLL
jgi:acylphosphatase